MLGISQENCSSVIGLKPNPVGANKNTSSLFLLDRLFKTEFFEYRW
jgi:hypothetical protein